MLFDLSNICVLYSASTHKPNVIENGSLFQDSEFPADLLGEPRARFCYILIVISRPPIQNSSILVPMRHCRTTWQLRQRHTIAVAVSLELSDTFVRLPMLVAQSPGPRSAV